ncbi:dynein regulatory complex protein 1 homolog [Drosophila gunungcola]|uniref:dynein regulatory complex protein 1 homolog n=1 Tax=Drosophila gunungcola TaxID=103775 RepID=UPI0022E7CE41|nr:dynein regulatory complex protein 1 homolog [Drosophila gunungcola]
MDDNDDEVEEHQELDLTGDVSAEEEEAVEADLGPVDSWESFNDRIDGMIFNEHCDKPVKKLDERRLAILNRVRQQFHEAPKGLADRCQAQKSSIDQQLALSGERLNELVRFGNELVTNVRVANERRELNRRFFEATQKNQVQTKLQRESTETMARFENIKARWTELEETNEPMLLWDQIEEQKKRIAEIMARKDEMIATCQQEVDRMNAKYEFDRERQAQDLCCLVERVDHQVETLKEAYKEHLEMLRHTIEEERQIFAANAVEKWRTFFDAMNANFDEKANLVKTREQFYARQTQQINESQEELTKSTRIRLEKECERLELELRRTRDNVLMNSEKLDYNYQVLQKRNEENVIINNQQKRRVARLHEAIGHTRRALKNLYLNGKRSIARLSSDIYKLHANINDMESKAHQARLNNREKFDRIWEINYKELNLLVDRVYHIDRIIHEQQLAMPWSSPVPPIPNINKSKKKRNNILERFDMRIGRVPKNRMRSKSAIKHRPDIKELPPESLRLMRNLIRKLSDRGGFLIEEQLLKILEPNTVGEKCLVRIDNIFAALRIRHLRDVNELTKVFMPYTYCPTCQPQGLSPLKCAEVFMKDQKPSRLQTQPMQAHQEQEEHRPAGDADGDRMGELKAFLAKGEESAKRCPNHYLVMEPALCLHAMNLFTSKMHKQMYEHEQSSVHNAVNLIQITDSEIRDFWRQFSACFPASKCKLWKTLEHGLNHYVEVLKMRVQYDAEVVFLRRQNEELRHLLQKFTV